MRRARESRHFDPANRPDTGGHAHQPARARQIGSRSRLRKAGIRIPTFRIDVDDAKPRNLISLLGELAAEHRRNSRIRLCLRAESSGEFPVAVMSELQARSDRRLHRFPIEFMPTRRHLPVTADEYERHLRRRWSLMIAKWDFTKEIELGAQLRGLSCRANAEAAAEPLREEQTGYRSCQRGVKRHVRPHSEKTSCFDHASSLERAVARIQVEPTGGASHARKSSDRAVSTVLLDTPKFRRL